MKMFNLIGLIFLCFEGFSQNYTPGIEPCPCLMKVDPLLESRCGYLRVPENRSLAGSRWIKIPFVFIRKPGQDSARNITLYTTGGPGYSTISPGDSIGYQSGYLAYGGFIFFNQRGTKNSEPCLDCEGVDDAVRTSYLYNLPKDSLIGVAVKQCRNQLIKRGIDLSAYNTVESAADISDLKQALRIDSLTLLGASYSGGLMLTVARNHPEGIKALLLNSPLPGYVNYEEHALFNHNEALNALFEAVERDSAQNARFSNLRQKFKSYFSNLTGKKFTTVFQNPKNQQTYSLYYTRDELLDAVINRMNNGEIRQLPQVMWDIIHNKHEPYITSVLVEKFAGNPGLSYGMRLSVYCSEQIGYSDPQKIKDQDRILPWLAGYPFNNVNHFICSCWPVKLVASDAKTPVYSSIPALVSAGVFDPWTRPFYNRLIKRTMPNAQLIFIQDRAHGAGFGTALLDRFLLNPYQKLSSSLENEIIE